MLKYIFSFVLFVFFMLTGKVYAQVTSFEKNYQKKYEARIKKSYLYKVYIPKDLNEVFLELNKKIEKKSRIKFQNSPENLSVHKLHFSLGRWMTYNWQFYEGSRLSQFLKELGLFYPDDMSSFLIRSYHRSLNRNKLDIKEQIKVIQNYRKKKFEKEMAEKEVIKIDIKKRKPINNHN